jgi:hypothetical protein
VSFFEVRAQVDRDLTTIPRVDRLLGLIKNLGLSHFHALDLLCGFGLGLQCSLIGCSTSTWVLAASRSRPTRAWARSASDCNMSNQDLI